LILAKTFPDRTLLEHTEDVLKVFSELIRIYPDTPSICDLDRFWDYLFYALFFHDFGKAASGFQNYLRMGRRWKFRHEILSAGFVSVLDYPDEIKRLIALGIISHHRDLNEIREKHSTDNPLNPAYEDYIDALGELEENFGYLVDMIDLIPEFSEKYVGRRLTNFSIPDSVDDLVDAYKFAVKPFLRDVEDLAISDVERKRGIFMRGFVLACDYLASSGRVDIPVFTGDIKRVFSFTGLKDIQLMAGVVCNNAVVVAPTGYGKTEAGLLWVERNRGEIKARRVFYILPYTASINAMFRRFVNYFGEDVVGMKHYRAGYFIYKSFRDRGYSPEESAEFAGAFQDLNKKIFKQFKVMTHIQLVKEFFGVDGFEMRLSEMAGGLFIVDEIHSYDPRSIALILESLKILKNEFKAKFLIMSATVPEFLKNLFADELGIDVFISPSEDSLREISRHRINLIDDDMEVWLSENLDRVRRYLSDGLKVLIICNTVKRAQDIYIALRDRFDVSSALIHSRFALLDRERIEKKIDKVQLLVGTQAIEVSLDIDFDVMFTEIAPADRLFQRFGRVNRRGRCDPADVFVFTGYSDRERRIYDEVLLLKTMDEIRKVKRLTEFDVIHIVNSVYGGGFTGRQERIFNETREAFLSLRSMVCPFVENSITEDDFYALVRSRDVIPSVYESEYLKSLDESNYFEIVKFFVPIALSQFMKLYKGGQIYNVRKTCFCKVGYNPDLGLLVDEFETNIIE
jgi:CRISPR-associated endonuclease/helicase Cas3